MNAPHKINGKQLDVKKALPKDGSDQRGGRQGSGRNDSWGNGGGMYLNSYKPRNLQFSIVPLLGNF